MSCFLHKPFHPVKVLNAFEYDLPDGTKIKVKVGQMGVVKNIDPEKHLVEVDFEDLDQSLLVKAEHLLSHDS